MRLMQLNRISLLFFTMFFNISLGQSIPRLMTFTTTDINASTKEITITFTVPKKDFIYKDFITFSTDNPTVVLSPWKANKPTIAHYDSSFKEAKQIFNEDFTITITATTSSSTAEHAHLYCSYYRRSDKKINHALFPLVFTAPPTPQEHIDTNIDIMEYDRTTMRTKKKINYIDSYLLSALGITDTIITSVHTDHKKYFAFLIFLIIILISFLYFFKKELEKQAKIKELLEIITSLFILMGMAYILICMYVMSTPLLTMPLASIFSLYTGLFYTKKSTRLQSARLRTFCTFIGILCICGALLLSFKAVQYIDQQFNLL